MAVIFERDKDAFLEIFVGNRRIIGGGNECCLFTVEDGSFVTTTKDDDFLDEPIDAGTTIEELDCSLNESEFELSLRGTGVACDPLSKSSRPIGYHQQTVNKLMSH